MARFHIEALEDRTVPAVGTFSTAAGLTLPGNSSQHVQIDGPLTGPDVDLVGPPISVDDSVAGSGDIPDGLDAPPPNQPANDDLDIPVIGGDPIPEPLTATEPNERYVEKLYRDLLGRKPDSNANDFVEFLKNGGDRKAVADSILNSEEYLGRQIDLTFTEILGRVADAESRAGFIDELQNGKGIEDVEALLIGSREFRSRLANSTEYVAAALFTTLGEQPSTGLLSKYSQTAEKPTLEAAQEIVASEDVRTHRTRTAFSQFLGRDPLEKDTADFVSAMGKNSSTEALHLEILASDEYFHS